MLNNYSKFKYMVLYYQKKKKKKKSILNFLIQRVARALHMQSLLVLDRYLNLNQPHRPFLLFTIRIPLGECFSSPPSP